MIGPRFIAAIALVLAPAAAQSDPAKAKQASELRAAAYTAERRGDLNAAAEAFLKLVELEPNNPKWITRAADDLGKVGRFNEAMELLDQHRGRFADVPDIELMLARIFHLKADTMVAQGIRDSTVTFYYEDTARTAEAILERDPKHVEARLLLASARFQLGDFESALKIATEVATDAPDQYGGHAMVGRIRFQQFVDGNNKRNAERPRGKELHALRAEIYQHQLAATAAFEAASNADKTRSFPLVKLGDIAAWTGRIIPALTNYRRALALDPGANVDHAWLLSNARPEQRLELYEAAAADYRDSDHVDPTKAAILDWHTARCLIDTGDWKRARTLFDATLEALPNYLDTYYHLTMAAYWGGDTAGASDYALTFAQKNPKRFADMIRENTQAQALLESMADQAFAQKRVAKSRDLNKVLAFASQTAEAWNNYAFLARETKQFEDSYAAYVNALSLEPDSPQLLNDAGVILQYHLKGKANLERARKLYERAIDSGNDRLKRPDLDEETAKRIREAIKNAKLNLQKLRR